GRHAHRRGQVVHHAGQHRLHAAVLERRPADHRVGLGGDGQLPHTGADLLLGELFALEVLLHQLFGGLGDLLDELGAVLLGPGLQVLGDLPGLVRGTEAHITLGVTGPDHRLHRDQVDHADEVGLRTDRQLHHQRGGAEPGDDGLHRVVEVRTELVHLVDEADARHVVLVSLEPYRLRMTLYTL